MRVKTYNLLSDQVEAGLRGGLNKCYKRDYLHPYVDPRGDVCPSREEAAIEQLHHYVMNAIVEYFDWSDEVEED